jgi:hypothetical protein
MSRSYISSPSSAFMAIIGTALTLVTPTRVFDIKSYINIGNQLRKRIVLGQCGRLGAFNQTAASNFNEAAETTCCLSKCLQSGVILAR